MGEAVTLVVDQLSTFLREESALLGGLRHEVQYIKNELALMNAFRRNAEALAEENVELYSWLSEVRDVASDAEDCLLQFILRFKRYYAEDGDDFLGRVRKVYGLIRTSIARHRTATIVHTIKSRIKMISEAYQRYQVRNGNFEQGSSSVFDHNQNTWYVNRGESLFLEEADVVGIERPKKILIKMLLSEDSELRVVSVVGMGGLGKTTVVKKVYDDPNVKTRFKHHLWITVSQLFRIETLLNQVVRLLFKEVNEPPPTELDTMNTDSMRQLVRDFLYKEDYVLVLDDIWRPIDWEVIQRAFPRNNCGSRIIITTRNTDVGQAATSEIRGEIYLLEPLNEEESWTLFCKKAFRATSCPYHLEQISRNILDKCVGLPLAIAVIGEVLARKILSTEEWDEFNRSMVEQLTSNCQLDNMIKLIFLSHYDLPDHLRICFLYLSILPEDVSIDKTRLLRLWIAEGFVQKEEGMRIEEVAEDYLHQLINRNLVQIAETTVDGVVLKCRVHGMIQQVILGKAREQNITTILDGRMEQFTKKIRRLVISSPIYDGQAINALLRGLQSLIIFDSGNSLSKRFLLELLYDLRSVKVLDLEGAPLEEIPDEIFKALNLKYLSLRNTKVKTIPKSIGKFQELETLDLRDTNVTELPIEILKLQQLQHLLVVHFRIFKLNTGFKAPYKIGRLRFLQSLHNIDADQIVNEIGELIHLRKLGITNLSREEGKELCSSLEKLTNLRSLRVVSKNEHEIMDLQYSLSSTPQFLQTLKLWGRLENVPQWILSLQRLTRIELSWSRLSDDSLQLLQDLPNLVVLSLDQAYEGEGLYFRAGGFPKLKILRMMDLQELRWVTVEMGAMPLLQQLQMGYCQLVEELPAGLEHLTNLQEVEFIDMSDKFVAKLKDMDKQIVDYKNIAHIPRVFISNADDGYEHCNLLVADPSTSSRYERS